MTKNMTIAIKAYDINVQIEIPEYSDIDEVLYQIYSALIAITFSPLTVSRAMIRLGEEEVNLCSEQQTITLNNPISDIEYLPMKDYIKAKFGG